MHTVGKKRRRIPGITPGNTQASCRWCGSREAGKRRKGTARGVDINRSGRYRATWDISQLRQTWQTSDFRAYRPRGDFFEGSRRRRGNGEGGRKSSACKQVARYWKEGSPTCRGGDKRCILNGRRYPRKLSFSDKFRHNLSPDFFLECFFSVYGVFFKLLLYGNVCAPALAASCLKRFFFYSILHNIISISWVLLAVTSFKSIYTIHFYVIFVQ